MTKNKILAILITFSIIASGCAGKRVKFDLADPLFGYKNEFYSQYEYWFLDAELVVLKSLSTAEELDKFKENFWKIRDTDPSTPANEYKDTIDQRFVDVENEIFAADPDIPGTRFDRSGGLKGDLAHIYLLYGMPSFKDKLSEGTYHAELVVWYYLDYQGRHLMRFLFYENGGRLQLFKTHFIFGSLEDVLNPSFSPLKKLSNKPFISTFEEMWELWQEIERNDPKGIFRAPLFEFSHYTHIDKDTRWTIDIALAPPEPAMLTAERFKPTILGQPNIPEETMLFTNNYNSFIPAYLRIGPGPENPTFLMLVILNKNLDLEKQDDRYVASMNLRISFQNKKTLKLAEFFTGFKREISQEEFDKRETVGSTVVFPLLLEHWDGEKFTLALREMLKQIEPGEYVVNIYLQHTLTKKYNAWREEITIK